MSSECRTQWPDVLSNSSGNLKKRAQNSLTNTSSGTSNKNLYEHVTQYPLHVLQLLHDETVDHVWHVCRDFARREAKLAVE